MATGAPENSPTSALSAAAAAVLTAKAGTPIEVELGETVSTRTVKRGDRFLLKLSKPVVVDGQVVIAAGATGFGQVIDVGRPGLGGKPAKLVLAARELELGDQHAKLRSFFVGGSGVDSSDVAMVASFVPYAGIASIFIQGGQVVIPAGTKGHAKLAQDFTRTAPAARPPIEPIQ